MQLLVYFLSTATQLVTDRKKSRPFLLIHLIFITLKFLSTINVNRHLYNIILHLGFPNGSSGKESACQYRRHRLWVQSLGQKIPWRRKWQSTPEFLPGESHGPRSLMGYSLQGHKELDMAEVKQASKHASFVQLIVRNDFCKFPFLFSKLQQFLLFIFPDNLTFQVIQKIEAISCQKRISMSSYHCGYPMYFVFLPLYLTSISLDELFMLQSKNNPSTWVLDPLFYLSKDIALDILPSFFWIINDCCLLHPHWHINGL